MCFSRSKLSISPAALTQQQSPIFPTSKYFITMMCVLRNIIQLFILYAPLYIISFTIHSAFTQPFTLLSPDAVQMYCFKLLKYVRTFVLALCILGYHLNHPQHLQHKYNQSNWKKMYLNLCRFFHSSSSPFVIFSSTFPIRSVERNALSINSEIGLNVAEISMISFSFWEIEMCVLEWEFIKCRTECRLYRVYKYKEWKVLNRFYLYIIGKATAAELQR